MKKNRDFSRTLLWYSLCTIVVIIIKITVLFLKSQEPQPQTQNDVTFEVIETADSAGDYLIYDTATTIVYKGGSSPYKPYYSEDGYLYIYCNGRLEEVK